MWALFFGQKWQNSAILALIYTTISSFLLDKSDKTPHFSGTYVHYYIVIFVGQKSDYLNYPTIWFFFWTTVTKLRYFGTYLRYYILLFVGLKWQNSTLFWHLCTLLYRSFFGQMSDYLNYIAISLFFLEKVTKFP